MRRPLWQYLLGFVLLTGLVLVFFLFPQFCTQVSHGVSTVNSTMNYVLLWALGVMLLFLWSCKRRFSTSEKATQERANPAGSRTCTRLDLPKDQEHGPPA